MPAPFAALNRGEEASGVDGLPPRPREDERAHLQVLRRPALAIYSLGPRERAQAVDGGKVVHSRRGAATTTPLQRTAGQCPSA